MHITKYSPSIISKLSTAQHTIKRNIEILLRAATSTHKRRSQRITGTVKLRYTIDIVTKRIVCMLLRSSLIKLVKLYRLLHSGRVLFRKASATNLKCQQLFIAPPAPGVRIRAKSNLHQQVKSSLTATRD